MRVTRSLVLESGRHEVPVRTAVTVRVRDRFGRPVSGAVVESGSQRAITDETGRCRLRFDAPGLWKVLAWKAPSDRLRYRPATGRFRVVPTAGVAESGRPSSPLVE